MKRFVPPGVRHRVRNWLLRSPRKNPRYIPAHLGVSGVAAELNRRKVRYVILRWHDWLPHLPPGGDLDLLVHDDDIGEVDRVLASTGSAECDVYSVSGLAGTEYSGVPHLPPNKASELLDRAISFHDLYKVPTKRDYFLSLAFHSVYHKGFKTGLPSRYVPPSTTPQPKNDYRGTLAQLASELGLEVDLSLEALEEYLVSQGWDATPEMLTALTRRNAWIAARLDSRN